MLFFTVLPKLLNMSLTAAVVIVLLLLLRPLLRPLPKIIPYALWAVVLFRLLCPVSLSSALSLFSLLDPPVTESSSLTSRIEYVPQDIVHTAYPTVTLPVSGVDTAINASLPQGPEQPAADPLDAPMALATQVWLAGVLLMAVYSCLSYVRLRRQLRTASPLNDPVWCSDEISSPFVLGLVRPKIYLPSSLSEQERSYILLHEQHHIRRLDHLTRALSFAALCLHWFNPLVWVAFLMAGRDMEMSCDEAVIRRLGDGVRADYSASLLSLATGRRIIAGMPLAFGEGDTKSRIRNLANGKTAALGVILLAIIACAVLALCLLTNPFSPAAEELSEPFPGRYGVVEVTYERPGASFSMVAQSNTPSYLLTADGQLSSSGEYSGSGQWTQLGALTPMTLSKDNFDALFTGHSGEGWFSRESAASLRRNNARAWTLVYDQEHQYALLQQKNGELYLACGYNDHSEKNDPYSDDSSFRWLFKLAVEAQTASGVQEWLDYHKSPDMPWHSQQEIRLDAFPGVTFRWTPVGVEAIVDDAVTSLYTGMPVWSVFFTDLTGDGLPELCSTVSIGSGVVDDRVIVYDYARQSVHTLEERMVHDYHLFLQDGQLMVNKCAYRTDNNGSALETGRLAMVDGALRFVPEESPSGQLIPGTAYVPYECLYLSPLSSFAPFGGDNGCYYVLGPDAFMEFARPDGEIQIIVTDPVVDTAGASPSHTYPVDDWSWQPFPYTNEEWAALYPLADSALSRINDVYERLLYLPLSEKHFLLQADGDLWLVKLGSHPDGTAYLWSIYALVPEDAMGVAQWEFAPVLSSRSPVFSFTFDMTHDVVHASCTAGTLVEFNYGDQQGARLDIYGDHPLCWSPLSADGSIAGSAVITFTVERDGYSPYHGTLYLTSNGGSDSRRVYTARLVGTALHLDADPEYACGIISAISQIQPRTQRRDLGAGTLNVPAGSLAACLLYTNTQTIRASLPHAPSAPVTIRLLDVSQNNAEIAVKTLEGREKDVLFTGLSSNRLYRLDVVGSTDTVTVQDH